VHYTKENATLRSRTELIDQVKPIKLLLS